MRHAPLNGGIAHHANAMRVRNHHRTNKKSRFFHPGRTGHFAISVQRPPSREHRIGDRIIAPRQNSGYASAHRPLPDHQLALSGNERRVSNGHAAHVRNGIERARRAVKWNPEIASAWFHFVVLRLNIYRREHPKTNQENELPREITHS